MAGPYDARDIIQKQHEDPASAKRAMLVDASGNAITASNKLPVDATLTVGDIEIGAVEIKNGTDDTRATVTASNALKVDGSAVTQPVSGTKANAAPQSFTEASINPASTDLMGRQRIVTQRADMVINGMGYVATSNGISIAGVAEVPFFLLKNPNGSGKTVRFSVVELGVEASTAFPSVFRIYRNPTITSNGTSVTINNLLNGGAASAITTFKQPTISANGTVLMASVVPATAKLMFDQGLTISANENLLVTAEPSQTNNQHFFVAYWEEV